MSLFPLARACSALLLSALFAPVLLPPPARAIQASPAAPEPSGPSSAGKITDPRTLFLALNALTIEDAHVYDVENLSIERDVIRIRLEEGRLAFFAPINGQITGAVFSGRGHVIATPREAGERRSMAQFLGVPILDAAFTTAYLRFTDSTAEELQKQLEEDSAVEGPDAEFSTVWSGMLKDLNPSRSVRVLEDLLSTAPLPYFSALLAGSAKGPMELTLDQRRDEQVLIGQPRIINGEPAFDVWASFRATRSPDAPPPLPTFLPLGYQVQTTIAPDLSLTGVTTAHLKAARTGERVVPLELSKDLVVENVVESGQSLTYFQNENLNAREIQQRGSNLVFVALPSAVSSGQDFQLSVSYHGSVIRDAGNGVYFVGERGSWYAHSPEIGFFTPFDLTFHWPKRLTLVATGAEGKVSEQGDVLTARWQSEEPFAVAGFNLGEYSSESLGKSPVVRIFANQEIETSIAARLAPPAQMTLPEFPTSIPQGMQQPGTIGPQEPSPRPSDVLRQLGTRIEASVHFYETLNGKFPFSELEVSPIPGSFGQGWPGLVYLSTLAFLPPAAQQRAGLGVKSQLQTQELLPFHEVAHQWWGNVTTAGSYRDVWIEEAMATYQSLLFAESQKSDDKRMQSWLAEYRDDLAQKQPGKDAPVDQAGPLTLGFRLNYSDNSGAYDTIVYQKGAWVMHMLREMMRDDKSKAPDARFQSFLQDVLRDYAYHPLSTADFQKAAEAHMTPAMDLDGSHSLRWFFDEWVRQTGIPKYSVKFGVKPAGNGWSVFGTLYQKDVDDSFTERVPLFYSPGRGKAAFLGSVITTGTETHFHFGTNVKPERILIDPNMTVLSVND